MVRKLILCVVLFCSIFIGYGQAQEEPIHTLRVGINRAFFGSGDIIGPGIYGEYAYALNNYFAVTPRIMSAYANKRDGMQFDHASSFATSLSLRITPLPNSFGRLKLDFGGLYHRFINSYGSFGPEDAYGGTSVLSGLYVKEDLFGLIGSVSINLIDNKRVEGGWRFDMLTSFTEGYFNSDSMQTGLYFGVKF